jgi:thiol-disulfide isomerase/thioredoxin
MKQPFLILLLTLSLFGCKEKKHDTDKSSETGKFYPDIEQRSVLIGQIINYNDFIGTPNKIKLGVDDITIDSQHSFETEIDKDGNFIFDIPLYNPINTYLNYGDSRITPYLFPNDTMYLKCKIDRKGLKVGMVSGEFDEKHDKFQNDVMNLNHWIHYEQINRFRDKIPQNMSAKEIKEKYLEYEKTLLEIIENKIAKDSINDFLGDYLRYSAKYSIYAEIIGLNRTFESFEKKQEFFSFLNDSIVFNKKALITSDYHHFHNRYRFGVEQRPRIVLEPKERTKEQFREEITLKELEESLKMRQGVWSEFLAASNMFFTGFLEEEISQEVITSYSIAIERSFKDPYVKQLLLSRCDETREKVALINSQKIPKNAKLNQYSELTGEEMFNNILSDKKGKTIYIDVWATWCSPCKRQLPHSIKMQEMFQDVEFVYLCCQSKEETWENVIKQYQINGTHILLTEEQFDYMKEKFSIAGVPHYILIDKNGNIEFNDYPGCKTDEVIETKLKSLIANK